MVTICTTWFSNWKRHTLSPRNVFSQSDTAAVQVQDSNSKTCLWASLTRVLNRCAGKGCTHRSLRGQEESSRLTTTLSAAKRKPSKMSTQPVGLHLTTELSKLGFISTVESRCSWLTATDQTVTQIWITNIGIHLQSKNTYLVPVTYEILRTCTA